VCLKALFLDLHKNGFIEEDSLVQLYCEVSVFVLFSRCVFIGFSKSPATCFWPTDLWKELVRRASKKECGGEKKF
jgi:hypothetical protein